MLCVFVKVFVDAFLSSLLWSISDCYIIRIAIDNISENGFIVILLAMFAGNCSGMGLNYCAGLFAFLIAKKLKGKEHINTSLMHKRSTLLIILMFMTFVPFLRKKQAFYVPFLLGATEVKPLFTMCCILIGTITQIISIYISVS